MLRQPPHQFGHRQLAEVFANQVRASVLHVRSRGIEQTHDAVQAQIGDAGPRLQPLEGELPRVGPFAFHKDEQDRRILPKRLACRAEQPEGRGADGDQLMLGDAGEPFQPQFRQGITAGGEQTGSSELSGPRAAFEPLGQLRDGQPLIALLRERFLRHAAIPFVGRGGRLRAAKDCHDTVRHRLAQAAVGGQRWDHHLDDQRLLIGVRQSQEQHDALDIAEPVHGRKAEPALAERSRGGACVRQQLVQQVPIGRLRVEAAFQFRQAKLHGRLVGRLEHRRDFVVARCRHDLGVARGDGGVGEFLDFRQLGCSKQTQEGSRLRVPAFGIGFFAHARGRLLQDPGGRVVPRLFRVVSDLVAASPQDVVEEIAPCLEMAGHVFRRVVDQHLGGRGGVQFRAKGGQVLQVVPGAATQVSLRAQREHACHPGFAVVTGLEAGPGTAAVTAAALDGVVQPTKGDSVVAKHGAFEDALGVAPQVGPVELHRGEERTHRGHELRLGQLVQCVRGKPLLRGG